MLVLEKQKRLASTNFRSGGRTSRTSMIDKIDYDEDGSLSYNECIQHIRYTLADMCLKNVTDRFSIFRLINRAVFLFQEPLCFAICRRTNEGFLFDQNTIRDPLFEGNFWSVLENRFDYCKSTRIIKYDDVKEYVVSLFDTSFGIVAFRVSAGKDANFKYQNLSYDPVRSDDEEVGRTLRNIFKPFGLALRDIGVHQHLESIFAQLFESATRIKAFLDDPKEHPISGEGLNLMRRYEYKEGGSFIAYDYQSIEEIVQHEVSKLENSPAIMKGESLPNILIMRKRFNRKSRRFDAYHYGIDFFLSSTQRRCFLSVIKLLDRKRLMPFRGHSDIEEWFWRTASLSSGEELLEALNAPLSNNVRLFPEYSLSSGAAIIMDEPFQRRNLGWIKVGISRQEREVELRRLVVLHYLLQIMAPEVVNPSLLTLPIRVSGATWMAASFIVSGGAPGSGRRGVAPSEEFQRRFLIYHSLMRDFESRLRRKSKDAYIRSVYDVFKQYVDQKMSGASRRRASHVPVLGQSDFREINDRLQALCRVYPYDMIVFGEHEQFKELPEERVGHLGEACDVDFAILDGNPFFDRLRLRPFLNREDVRRRIRDMVNAELGHKNSKSLKLVEIQKQVTTS